MATNYNSNPNQNFYEKSPIAKYNNKDKENTVFATINCTAMGMAMKDLSPTEFKVWCYLAKNQPGCTLAISPAHALQWGGLPKDSFQKAIRVLKEKKYLILKEGTKNHFMFYEIPPEEEVIYVEKADQFVF